MPEFHINCCTMIPIKTDKRINLNVDKSLHILVTDDDHAVLESLRFFLEEEYIISVAESGEQAISLISSLPIDLVLLDITMPQMDGFEVARILAENPISSDIPIIFVTAYSDVDTLVKIIRAGGYDYVPKPVDINTLTLRIHKAAEQILLRRKNLEQQKLIEQQAIIASKVEIITMLSHQWRQPLGSISANISTMLAGLALGECNESDLIRFLNGLDQKVSKLASMIDQFLHINRSESHVETIISSDFFQSIAHFFQEHYGGLATAIELSESSLPTFEGDRLNLMSIINALIHNSLEAIQENSLKEGKIILSIEMDEEESLRITVEDNGGGISNESLHRLGEPYFTTKSLNGRGLSLYLAKTNIEQLLHGSIDFENTNKGLKSTLHIPLQKEKQMTTYHTLTRNAQ